MKYIFRWSDHPTRSNRVFPTLSPSHINYPSLVMAFRSIYLFFFVPVNFSACLFAFSLSSLTWIICPLRLTINTNFYIFFLERFGFFSPVIPSVRENFGNIQDFLFEEIYPPFGLFFLLLSMPLLVYLIGRCCMDKLSYFLHASIFLILSFCLFRYFSLPPSLFLWPQLITLHYNELFRQWGTEICYLKSLGSFLVTKYRQFYI